MVGWFEPKLQGIGQGMSRSFQKVAGPRITTDAPAKEWETLEEACRKQATSRELNTDDVAPTQQADDDSG